MKRQPNFFDDLLADMEPEETERLKKLQEVKGNRIDYLVHKVFEQSEDGKELLEIWKDSLILHPAVHEHSTQFGAGIEEGKKLMIRNIILTVRKVNNG